MKFLLCLSALLTAVAGDNMCCDTCQGRLNIYANQVVTTDPANTLPTAVKAAMIAQGLDFDAFIADAIRFYKFHFGVDFSTATPDLNNPQAYLALPTAQMVTLMFNHDKTLNYQLSDNKGFGGSLDCAYVSTYEVVVFFFAAGQPYGGTYGARHPGATITLGASSAYGYTRLRKGNKEKLFMTCGLLPQTSGPNMFNPDPVYSETDTPEPALYIDLEPREDKNWGIGESTKRAFFKPAFGPGLRKIVSNIDFPPVFYDGTINNKSCIPPNGAAW